MFLSSVLRSKLLILIGLASSASAQSILDTISVPQGFSVELAAESDLTAYPMFMTFDKQGRMFIAESTGKDLSGKEMVADPACQILRLVDNDGDGVYDDRTIFATELTLPMGVLWHQGSLFVASPPHFLRFDDTDGDGVADHREVLLTGWNVFNTASLHGPFLGQDGRLYLTHGRHGYKIKTKEGELLEGLAARVWRCWPDGTELERWTGGGFDNPVEVSFTSSGEMIGTMTYFTDPKHGQRDALLHFVKGGVYPKPHESINEFIHTGPDLMPVMTKFSRIAPSGLERFRSIGFGKEYKDSLFSAQFNPHRVQRHKLIRDGATFRTEDEDFLISTYPDFYPTDVLEDADGSLLVSDTGAWYVDACPISRVAKPNIKGGIYRVRKTGAKTVEDPWGNNMDWNSKTIQDLILLLGDSRVRVQDRAVQRLIAQERSAVPDLSSALLTHSDANVRLQSLIALRQIRVTGADGEMLKNMQGDIVRGAMNDSSLDIRLCAIQAMGDLSYKGALPQLVRFVENGSLAEVREAVTTLEQYPVADIEEYFDMFINKLNEPIDRFVEHAIIRALITTRNADALYKILTVPDSSDASRRAALIILDQIENQFFVADHAIPFIESESNELHRTGLWVASHHPEWANAVLASLGRSLRNGEDNSGNAEILQAYMGTSECRKLIGELLNDETSSPELSVFLLGVIGNTSLDRVPNQWQFGIDRSFNSTSESVRWSALDLVRARGIDRYDERLTAIFNDKSESNLFRLTALTSLGGRLETLTDAQFEFVLNQMTQAEEPGLRQSAGRLLGMVNIEKAYKRRLAVDYLPSADALVLTSILDAFCDESDEELGNALIEGSKANEYFADYVNAGQLDATFAKFPDSVQEQAKVLYAQLEKGDAELIERFTKLEADMAGGDVGRGRRIFFGKDAACSTCHAIGDEGGDLGPDLTTIGLVRSGHDLLEAVMFPNSSFVPDFQPYTIETKDDEVHAGIIGRESAEGIVLRTGADEERFIARSQIVDMTVSAISIMPEGLDSGMDDQELLDLMAFLRSLNNSQWLLPEDNKNLVQR